MARPTANLRLFVAVYPPRERTNAWLAALDGLAIPEHRLTPAEQVHMTLQFIGDTPAKAMDETIESVKRATGGLAGFDLRAESIIALPERGRKRLLAVQTDAPPTLMELQHRLAIRLARNVRKNPGRKFRPHLTICRFRSPQRVDQVPTLVSRTEDSNPFAPFPVERIQLMRSTLKPSGAEHHEVAVFDLA